MERISIELFCLTNQAGKPPWKHKHTYIATLRPLSMTEVVLNMFLYLIKALLLEMKHVFKHQDLQMFCLKLNKYK